MGAWAWLGRAPTTLRGTVPGMVDRPLGVVLAEHGTSGLDLFEQLTARPVWHARAACRGKGTEAWFPGRNDDTADARAACAGCPVAGECAAAGRGEKYGIWAGRSGHARRHGTAA